MSMIGRVMIEVVSNQGNRSIKKIMVYDNGGSAGVAFTHAYERSSKSKLKYLDMKQKDAFHAPLHILDTEQQTHGCRHTNPIICSRHNLPSVCAFAREDNICLAPPTSWAKQFTKLKDSQAKNTENTDTQA